MSNQYIQDLLKSQVEWIKEHGLPKWHAMVDGEECQLLLNDFPEEALYTLKWRESSLDVEESPPNWSIPRQ
jgi:hypothetical protein